MIKVFVDTDIIIDFSKEKNEILRKLLEKQRQGSLELFVNPVVVAEFFTDRKLKAKIPFEQAKLLFRAFSFVDITKEAGLLAAVYLREEHANFLGDALIGATCVLDGLHLATGNKRHYQRITYLVFYNDSSLL